MSRKAIKGAMLPEGWQEVKLGEVCFIDKETLSSMTSPNYCFKYISLSDVRVGKLLQTSEHIFSTAPSRARRIVQQGDILLATVRPNLEGFYIFRNLVKDHIVSTGFAVLTPKPQFSDSGYIFQYLFSECMLSAYMAFNVGSNYPALNSSDIYNFKIFIPPLPEQKFIASLLEKWDTAIEKTEALIVAKEQQFKWLLKTLISDQQDNPEWREVKLGDVCENITTGKLDANKANLEGQYRFYTCAKKYYWIDTYAFDDEALLISGNGAHVGYIHYYNGKFNAYQRTYVLTGFSEDIQYLKHFMEQNLKNRIRTEVNAGNMPYIKMGTLANMPIKLPFDSEKQKTIANMLNKAQRETDLLKQLTEQYRTQKRGLMQKLLTGDWRVTGYSD